MMELLFFTMFLLAVTVAVYLGNAILRPTWTDCWEFAVITALWPLSISCNIFWIAVAVPIVLTAWNGFVWRRIRKNGGGSGKALLRLIIIPVLFVVLGICWVLVETTASC